MHHILLLHGAIGSKEQLTPLAGVLKEDYTVHALNFSGHGGEAFAERPFSIQLFAEEVLQYLDKTSIAPVHIFGYSMGGYVGMWLARHYPEKVHKVITLATKYHWDEATAIKETGMLNAEKILQKLPDFAADLQRRHAPNDWTTVLEETKKLMLDLGAGNGLQQTDYPAITHPCLLLLGDRDKMVSLDETIAVYRQLPSARLGVLPGTSHPLEQVDVALLATFIRHFAG